ncbi:glycosyl hydrolase family 95 catalytic domain-containing protein [Solitalea lacus]|uniref:glycosyl hydrolase family 95 catalytic domain-containing protein n=1 Tax=Solitalea lacus TaxID=2911172 RepID=UPI001EDB0232|nr:hypothetical protein [Solitalea lacus]UKJ08316.1 hypothetical protein L2B55_03875 [Solitalea lacus]
MKKIGSVIISKNPLIAVVLLTAFFVGKVKAQDKSAETIISKYRNVFEMPPQKTPSNVAVDAPLLGNGSCAAALAGPPEQQTYYLSRNDFWRLKTGYDQAFPAVLGKLQINIPALKQAHYRVEQDIYNAATISNFSKADTSVIIQSTLMATQDLLLVEITNTGAATINGSLLLLLPQKDQVSNQERFPDTLAFGSDASGVQWIQRGFVKDVTIKSMAAAALKIVGKNSDRFTLASGQKITVVCSLSSNFKSGDCLRTVCQYVQQITLQEIKEIQTGHVKWWHRFWNESYVDIADSVIEHQYYRSQYNMASCSRDSKFPPGIFGTWITKETPAWNGDYHLNYNYSAPFYALHSSNHLQQLLPYEAPLLDFMERGRYYSTYMTDVPDGVLYPVGIGPLGIETTRVKEPTGGRGAAVEEEGLFLGQKSNAAYCVTNLSMTFYRTHDAEYAKRVYPFIRSVAVFWQHYLQKENDRYIILNDAIHEGTIGTMNPILSLGLVPMVFSTAIDMSILLNTDKDLRSDWQFKMNHVAKFSTQIRNGKTVFRYSERGTDWWPDNTLGIQHIYPAGLIGLESDSTTLQIAKNTIDELHRWKDFNGTNSFYPAAVRVGYNADSILANIHNYSLRIYPNGFQKNNPHGIENCSTVPNTINEMLCMSNQQVLRVFKVWPHKINASFSNIRSEGAFLVSSTLKDQSVQFVKIISEKGRVCILENPWPDKVLLVKSNKRRTQQLNGERIQLPTLPGETLTITAVE